MTLRRVTGTRVVLIVMYAATTRIVYVCKDIGYISRRSVVVDGNESEAKQDVQFMLRTVRDIKEIVAS